MPEPNHATIACAFATDEAIIAAMHRLSGDGIVSGWRVGAVDKDRALSVARATGANDDLDPSDPLQGISGVASGPDAAEGVNRGAVVGAMVGAIAGLAGSPYLGSLIPVDPSVRMLASTLLFFSVGTAVGGVLGGAFGKRPSTHAGFRLIDAMEAGDIAAIGAVESARVEEARALLRESGAAEIVVIAG